MATGRQPADLSGCFVVPCAQVDDGAGVGAVARVPVDAGDAAGAELHERHHHDARYHGMAAEPAIQRAPDAGLSGPAASGVTAHRGEVPEGASTSVLRRRCRTRASAAVIASRQSTCSRSVGLRAVALGAKPAACTPSISGVHD